MFMNAYLFSGRDEISPSINFWIASASPFVIPSPTLEQSALALPCSEIWNFDGFESDCMIRTASEISTVPSQLASPRTVTEGAG